MSLIVPQVSVIIPCFNAENFVEKAVASAFASSIPVEVICVDNNSKDNTLEKLQQLKEKWPSLVIAEEKQAGANYARNKGMSLANGEFLQFLDADDEITRHKIEEQLDAIQQADVVVAPYTLKQIVKGNTEVHVNSDIWKGLFKTELGVTSSCLFRKSKIIAVGGWNVELSSSQEYDLLFRLLIADARLVIHQSNQTIIHQREDGQISTGDPKPRWRNYLLLRERVLNYLMENEKSYFQREKSFFLQNFFDIIHTTYPHNPELARHIYKKYIKGKYKPKASSATSGSFIALMRLLGFEGAERIKSMIK